MKDLTLWVSLGVTTALFSVAMFFSDNAQFEYKEVADKGVVFAKGEETMVIPFEKIKNVDDERFINYNLDTQKGEYSLYLEPNAKKEVLDALEERNKK